MEILSHSVQDTLGLGKLAAKKLKPGDIICLYGDLGSGKTVFAKGIAEGLGIKKNTVISPTFVLIRQYSSRKLPVYHFDLYRLRNEQDILDLGYEEYFYGGGVSVIEWADRLHSILPHDYLKIELSVKGEQKRLLKFSASGRRHLELLKSIQKKLNENLSY